MEITGGMIVAGMALSDSPIGLAAYILEKFATWTDKSKMDQDNGGLLDFFFF